MRERISIGLVVALYVVVATPARGQVQAFYTFSSGPAPGGDGFDWPTPLQVDHTGSFYTPQGIGLGGSLVRVDSGFTGLANSRQFSSNNPAMWSDRATLDFQFGVIGGADSVSFDVALAFLWGDTDPGSTSPPEIFVSAFDFPSRTGSTLFPALPDEFSIGLFGVGRGRRLTVTAADFGLTKIDYLNIGSYDTGPPYELGIDNLSINGATHPWARQAILLNTASAAAAAPFPRDQMMVLPVDASAVGVLQGVTGAVTVTRPNGTRVPAVVGMPIYTDDVIETDAGGSANIVFVDDTNFAVSPNARLDIDEYVYDPGAESPENNFNFLRGVREFFRDAVGSDPEDPNNVPIGGFGIRGDATPYINWDPLNPAAEMRSSTASVAAVSDEKAFAGDAVAADTESVSLYTAVEVPDAPFELAFDYAFLDGGGVLDVTLDGVNLLTLTAAMVDVDAVYRYTLDVTDPEILALLQAELAFTYQGDVGSSMFIDNVSMPGLNNGDFGEWDNGWFSRGPGQVDLIATVVPEPAALSLLGLIALAGRRARSRVRRVHHKSRAAR